ncbi:hypothetical protein PSTG_07640 [Puccinia striiformis f. sp. tritici PST-78]|uniref:RING-type domain-containing protein n=1 Tax=Puccinia striiformis f. sp. tritici PST-78 TaxID=1165861 RepID=A0A0L0VIX3_9BASI|nr:hypothetical protein PSTG_07640 [Puccinia striiformis f. sp. tritici PST-78]
MNNEDENSTRKECPICLDSLYYHQVSSLDCFEPCHSFHTKCIAEWFDHQHKRSVTPYCPFCRTEYPKAWLAFCNPRWPEFPIPNNDVLVRVYAPRNHPQAQPAATRAPQVIEKDRNRCTSTTNAQSGSTNPIAQPAATRASKQNRRTSTTNAQSGSTNPIAQPAATRASKRNRHTSTTNAQSGSTNPIAQPAATRASKRNRRTSTTNAQSGSINPIAQPAAPRAPRVAGKKQKQNTSTTNPPATNTATQPSATSTSQATSKKCNQGTSTAEARTKRPYVKKNMAYWEPQSSQK